MTKQEALFKIDELKKFIAELDSSETVRVLERNYKTVIVEGQEWLADNLYLPELAFHFQKGDKECYFTQYAIPAIEAILPEGWRIPAAEDYRILSKLRCEWVTSDGVKGRIFADKLFFPASGYRLPDTGVLNVPGSYGYGWSSTQVSATNGYFLYFFSTSVNPANNSTKAHGLPVRIVRDVKN